MSKKRPEQKHKPTVEFLKLRETLSKIGESRDCRPGSAGANGPASAGRIVVCLSSLSASKLHPGKRKALHFVLRSLVAGNPQHDTALRIPPWGERKERMRRGLSHWLFL